MRKTDQTWLSLGLLVLLVVAIAAVGCGESESPATGKPPTAGESPRAGEPHLTKLQFLKRGNAICTKAEAEQKQLAAGHEKDLAEHPEMKDVLRVFLPPMWKELRSLRALNPPQGDEEKVQALVRAIHWGVLDAEIDFLDLYVKRADPFATAERRAARYGLGACAGSPRAVIKPTYRVRYGVGAPIG